MPVMTYHKIIQELKKGQYQPIYFLMGDEPYYIDLITEYIEEHALPEAEKSFNQTVVYGKDTDVRTIISLARRFPMMAEHQVFIVKEAKDLRKIDDLVHYVENPQKKTILVVNHKHGSIPKNKKLYKRLKDKAVVLESKQLYDNQVPDWILNFVKEKGLSINPPTAQLLADYLGSNLTKIANELNKLIITMPEGQQQITDTHIERNIGISKTYNVYELNRALSVKDSEKVYRIINYFGANQKENHISRVIITLYYFFVKVLAYHYIRDKSNRNQVASVLKVNPFFVKEYQSAARHYNARKAVSVISILREYDVRSKGVGNLSTGNDELLREMIYKIMN